MSEPAQAPDDKPKIVDKSPLWRRLRAAASARGWTMNKLFTKAEVKRGTVHAAAKREVRKPGTYHALSEEIIRRLANALGESPNYIRDGAQRRESPPSPDVADVMRRLANARDALVERYPGREKRIRELVGTVFQEAAHLTEAELAFYLMDALDNAPRSSRVPGSGGPGPVEPGGGTPHGGNGRKKTSVPPGPPTDSLADSAHQRLKRNKPPKAI